VDDQQTIVNWVFGLLTMILGFFVKSVKQNNKDLQVSDQELHGRITAVEILVAGDYVKRSDHKEDMKELRDHIDNQFKNLREDLKTKVDKL
jgi:hypothetical protein